MNKSEKSNYYANRGVKRNKAPIYNLVYKIELIPYERLSSEYLEEYKEKYSFKDSGIISLLWKCENNKTWNWHGAITVDELKERIGQEQYRKFCNGKREFIIQRRINGKNI